MLKDIPFRLLRIEMLSRFIGATCKWICLQSIIRQWGRFEVDKPKTFNNEKEIFLLYQKWHPFVSARDAHF